VGPSNGATGNAAADAAMVRIAVLGESVSIMKQVSIGLILAGVVGLYLSGATPP
jgi:multidrug transporter EmrE-like cation transporter